MAKRPSFTVLVVDDSVDIQWMLAEVLECEGLRVLTASNGEEALKILSSAPLHAVITDYQMEKMDGLELLRRIQQEWPRLPVFLMSGAPLTATAALDSVVAVFKKPFDLSALVGAVLRSLKEEMAKTGCKGG